MSIDLHTHSSYSDGTFTPTQIADLASERGLAVWALTDHDTTAGLAEAAEAADAREIELVPGVEFSASLDGGSIHVLAYWPDPGSAEFADELARLHDERFRRGERMVEKLQALGHPISFDRVREIAEGDNIVRPHIAQALAEAGVVETPADAFTADLIADGGLADVPKHALHPVEAVGLIRRAGGACVLAHPGMWGRQGAVPDELIEEMAEAGMAGLEVDHPDHDEEARAKYGAVAEALDLVHTGSSDCHGTRYEPIRLGSETTTPGAFDELKRRAGRE
ncbi:MAG: PHP domain-containing protein [Actinomycetota bacterium]